jgi:hypothetical protein
VDPIGALGLLLLRFDRLVELLLSSNSFDIKYLNHELRAHLRDWGHMLIVGGLLIKVVAACFLHV